MEAHVLIPLLGGVVLGACGVALGFWLRLRANAMSEAARLTFHKPAADVVVVEMRSRATAEQAEQLRARLLEKMPGTDVLVVVLDPNDRL